MGSEELYPLKALREQLREEFPLADQKSQKRIDEFLLLDGKLNELIYESIIDYASRRLVVHAKYILKKSLTNNEAEKLEESLQNTFRMGSIDASTQMTNLTYECYKKSLIELPQSTSQRIKKECLKDEASCYICGTTLTYSDRTADNYCEAEHLLPRSLGGTNQNGNLKGSCKLCNKLKRDRLSAADLHHESMVYPFSEDAEDKIQPFHHFAARFFNNHSCEVCQKKAEFVGDLKVIKRTDTDGWHLFNTMLVCINCEINT